MMESGNMHGWGMGLYWIFGLLFICLLIWLLLEISRNSYSNENKKLSASDIIRKRYAKGEITKSEKDKLLNEIK